MQLNTPDAPCHAVYLLQDAVPKDNSLICLMLRTTNKETGKGLTDMQIVAQSNTFLAAGEFYTVRSTAFISDCFQLTLSATASTLTAHPHHMYIGTVYIDSLY